MDIFNKKSMFFLLAITCLICSSFADRLPQDGKIEERELVAVDAFGGFTKAFSNALKALGTKGNWWNRSKTGFKVGIKTARGYKRVTNACMKAINCTPANRAQDPFCGAYCVYDMVATTGQLKQCVKHCNSEERSQQVQNCFYHADGRITCG